MNRWATGSVFPALAALLACTGERPSNLGLIDGLLAPCPDMPNCVSSDAPDQAHYVAPFRLTSPSDAGWATLREVVTGLPRVTVVEESEDYLRVEVTSAIFRFVDDVELHRREDGNLIAVRSASRLGKSDLGVNRDRVEELRELLGSRGALAS